MSESNNIFNTVRDTGQLTDRIRVDITEKISDDILLDNIIEQINKLDGDIEKIKIDFLEDFETRVSSIQELYSYDEKLMITVKNIQSKVYSRILAEICEKYAIEINFRDNLLVQEQYELVGSLYRFFVVNLFDNLTQYGLDVCLNSIDNILELNKENIDVKDPIYTAYKNKFNERVAGAVIFMSHILDCINITNLYEFVNTIVKQDPDEYDNMLVSDTFNEEDTYVDLGITVGEPSFLQTNIEDNYRLRQEIENAVVRHLIEKGGK